MHLAEKKARNVGVPDSTGYFLQSGLEVTPAELRQFSAILEVMQPDFSATQTVWRGLEDDFRTLILSGFDPETFDFFAQEISPASPVQSPTFLSHSVARTYEDCHSATIDPIVGSPVSAECFQEEATMSASGMNTSTGNREMPPLDRPENARIDTKEEQMSPEQVSHDLGEHLRHNPTTDEESLVATTTADHEKSEQGRELAEGSRNELGRPKALADAATEHDRRVAGAHKAWIKIRANRAAKAQAMVGETEQRVKAADPAPCSTPLETTAGGAGEGASLEAVVEGSVEKPAVQNEHGALAAKAAEHDRRVAGAHKAWVKIRANRAAKATSVAKARAEQELGENPQA
jgi:hypothetical protein